MKILLNLSIILAVLFSVSFASASVVSAQDEAGDVPEVEVTGDGVEVIQTETRGLVLYVSEGCGHCEKVEKFIVDNDLLDEVVIRNVSVDEEASEEYTEFLDSVGVPLEERGVPVLVYSESEFAAGDTPIIDYLAEEFGIEEEKRTYTSGEYALLIGGTVVVAVVVGYGIVKAVNGQKEQ